MFSPFFPIVLILVTSAVPGTVSPLPGTSYNKSRRPDRLATWTMPPAAPTDWSNTPTLTAWHNQGWFQAT